MIRHWLRRPFQCCRSACEKKNAVFRVCLDARGASSDESALVGGDTRADEPTPMRMLSPELVDLQVAELRRSRRGRR